MSDTAEASEPDSVEDVVSNAAAVESLAGADYGAVLSARGLTLVALNGAGEIVEYRPDGGSLH